MLLVCDLDATLYLKLSKCKVLLKDYISTAVLNVTITHDKPIHVGFNCTATAASDIYEYAD